MEKKQTRGYSLIVRSHSLFELKKPALGINTSIRRPKTFKTQNLVLNFIYEGCAQLML